MSPISAPQQAPTTTPIAGLDPKSLLTTSRVFNSALVTSLVQSPVQATLKPQERLMELQRSPEFKSILLAVQSLAQASGRSERACTESLLGVLREMDSLWGQIVQSEGLKRITSAVQNPNESG